MAENFNRRAIPPGAIESRWAAPDGHLIRRIDWPEPATAGGSLLFMPGRGDAYEKYLETLEHWHRCGWRVTAADWRGQAGSGRLGQDEFTGHVDDFEDWVGDLAAFWREWSRKREGPLVLVGHSMGSHLVLRAVAERELDPPPAALALVAPMLDVLPEALPWIVKYSIARIMTSVADSRRPAWKWGKTPGELPEGRQALLTHHDERYEDELWWRRERPELVMGPGSWGWIASALQSIRRLDRPGVLEAVDLPVYIAATRADRLVGARAIHHAAGRLRYGQVLWFGAEAGHEILREVDPIRERALAAIDDFLAGVCPK